MARLGEYIQEEKHPLGSNPAKDLKMVGVSNEEGLHASSRATSTDTSRYIRVDRDWFAYNPMRINIGSIGLADDDSKTGFTSPDYTVFSCKKDLNPTYLLHFLKSDYGLEAIAKHCSGAVRKRLYYSGLAEIDLRIPSIEEQSKIVKRIDSIQSAIRKIRDENSDKTELPQLKQAILQEAIQGKITAKWRAENPDVEPASELLKRIQSEKAQLIADKKIRKEKPLPKITPEEIPFEIPEGWEWCRFGEVVRLINGASFASGDFKKGDGIKCIKITNTGVGEFIETDDTLPSEFDEKHANYRVFSGDMLLALTRPYIADGLKISKCPESYDRALLNQRVAAIRPLNENLHSDFAFLFLSSEFVLRGYQAEFDSKGQQPNLKSVHITHLRFPLPPLAEQAAIVERVEALMTTCRALEEEIEQSRTNAAHLLQAVLKEAFSSTARGAGIKRRQ